MNLFRRKVSNPKMQTLKVKFKCGCEHEVDVAYYISKKERNRIKDAYSLTYCEEHEKES